MVHFVQNNGPTAAYANPQFQQNNQPFQPQNQDGGGFQPGAFNTMSGQFQPPRPRKPRLMFFEDDIHDCRGRDWTLDT